VRGRGDGVGKKGEGKGGKGKERRGGKGRPLLLSLHFKHWLYPDTNRYTDIIDTVVFLLAESLILM